MQSIYARSTKLSDVGSMLVAAIPLARLFMQKTRGPAAKAQLMELVNDQFGLAAALVATILIPLGYPLADPIERSPWRRSSR